MNTFQKFGSAVVLAGSLTSNVQAGIVQDIDSNLKQYPWYSQLAQSNTSYNTRYQVVTALTVAGLYTAQKTEYHTADNNFRGDTAYIGQGIQNELLLKTLRKPEVQKFLSQNGGRIIPILKEYSDRFENCMDGEKNKKYSVTYCNAPYKALAK